MEEASLQSQWFRLMIWCLFTFFFLGNNTEFPSSSYSVKAAPDIQEHLPAGQAKTTFLLEPAMVMLMSQLILGSLQGYAPSMPSLLLVWQEVLKLSSASLHFNELHF